jgi:glycosyltransferase involved in cell wall biosynthesis
MLRASGAPAQHDGGYLIYHVAHHKRASAGLKPKQAVHATDLAVSGTMNTTLSGSGVSEPGVSGSGAAMSVAPTSGIVTSGNAVTRVSVVVPTCNRSGLLQEALDSIFALDGPDLELEVLICDNACSPEVQEIAERRGARYLPVHEAGAAAARNTGMVAATGEYLAFLDDDDLWLPEHLRGHLAMLAARPELEAVVGQVVLTNLERERANASWPAWLPDDGDVFTQFLNMYPQIGATVARVGVRDTVGFFDGSAADDEDWDWHLRLSERHGVGFVPTPCVLFRQRPVGTCDDLQWSRIDATMRVYFRHLAAGGKRRPSLLRAARGYFQHRGMYFHYFAESAALHLAEDDRSAAWTSLKRAMLISPLHAARDLARASSLRNATFGLLRGKAPERELLPG